MSRNQYLSKNFKGTGILGVEGKGKGLGDNKELIVYFILLEKESKLTESIDTFPR